MPQALVSSKQALQALAAYHIVPSGVRTTQMSNGQQLPTLARDAQVGRQACTPHVARETA